MLPTAYCLLPSPGGIETALGRLAALDKMSPPTGKEQTRSFKK
jgi:hypothetical protein